MPSPDTPPDPAPDRNNVSRITADWLAQQQINGTSLVVGVSGGADSVALLRALHACRDEISLKVIMAHLDHALREDSASDAEWVRSLANQLQLEVVVERTDVAQMASDSGQGLEETARRQRYDFFRRVAESLGCRYVAVAHTADDQVETVLHHLLRGTGLSGLQGMPASRPLSESVTLIRPLLSTSRESVVAYLSSLGQEFLTDKSNTDEQFTRNRVRHRLLPLLREEFNPQVDRALHRLSKQACDVQEMLEVLGKRALYEALREQSANRVRMHADVLREQPTHLLREVFRLLWIEQDWPRQRMGFDDWNRLAEMVQNPESSKSISFPHNVQATRSRACLVLEVQRA